MSIQYSGIAIDGPYISRMYSNQPKRFTALFINEEVTSIVTYKHRQMIFERVVYDVWSAYGDKGLNGLIHFINVLCSLQF